jgi:hypothetical protein
VTAATSGEDELEGLQTKTRELSATISVYARQTGYEDLDHAVLALNIVTHALNEVAEHTGLGGTLPRTPDPAAHEQARALLAGLADLTAAVRALHTTHPNDDSEAALTALEITHGSLTEVAERYEP